MRYFFGGQVREVNTADSVATVEGLSVPFTQPEPDGAPLQGVDLYLTYFNRETNYYISDLFNQSRAFYRHMADAVISDRLLGAAKLTVREANGTDPAGLWGEAQIQIKDEYDAMMMDLVKKGALGISTGASETMYEVRPMKIGQRELGYVSKWGVIDWTLTPQPASFGTEASGRELRRPLTQREYMDVLQGKSKTRVRPTLRRRRDVLGAPDVPAEDPLDFEAEIAELTPSRWEIEDTLSKMAANIAGLAKMAVALGQPFDLAAAIEKVMAGYHRVMGAHIFQQIEEWLEGDDDDYYYDGQFYLRSLAIEDTNLDAHSKAAVNAVGSALNRFRGRRERRSGNRGLSNSDAGRLTELRAALQRQYEDAGKILGAGAADAPAASEYVTAEESAALRRDSRRRVF
jgi:hypothetical protein